MRIITRFPQCERLRKNAADVSSLVVGSRFGKPIYVHDVANVIDGPEETYQLVNYYSGPAADSEQILADGASAVTIAIAKKEGTNGVSVAHAILRKLDGLKGRLIPDNVQAAITRNYGKTANDKVNELLISLLGATVAVSILCWLTIGARPALVALSAKPKLRVGLKRRYVSHQKFR